MSSARTFAALVAEAKEARLDIALILGSGLTAVAEHCRPVCRLPFGAVPGLSATSVAGHQGRLTLADWAGKRVLLFEGRLHYYEGHSWRSVVRPIQIAHSLGASVLLLTNAAGGIREDLYPGCLMAISDHLELTRPYCWRLSPSPHPLPLGGEGGVRGSKPRASAYSTYSTRLLQRLGQAASDRGVDLRTGIYAAVTGPCYETPAEIRALKAWGADAVGMSIAREVLAGHELGMECAALSCITNRAAGLSTGPIHHEDVLKTAAAQSERLANLLEGFLELVPS